MDPVLPPPEATQPDIKTNKASKDNLSSMMKAALQTDDSNTFKFLLLQADPLTIASDRCRKGRTLLHYCSSAEKAAAAKVSLVLDLLSDNTDQLASFVSIVDKAGENALHVSARCGNLAVCRLLLTCAEAACPDFRATVLNIQSKGKGDTPLILASCWGRVAVSQFLIEAGADTTLTTRNGFDAARWAQWYDRKRG